MIQKNFANKFTVVGLVIIMSMFANIVGHINNQSNIDCQDVHVISAFDG